MSVLLPNGKSVCLVDLFTEDSYILNQWRKTLKASRLGKKPLVITLDDKFLYLNEFIDDKLYHLHLNLELMTAIDKWDTMTESDKEPYTTRARYINSLKSPYDVYAHTIYSDAYSVMQVNNPIPDHSRVEKLILQSWKKLHPAERAIFTHQYSDILLYKRSLIAIELLSDIEFNSNPDIVHRFFSCEWSRYVYMRPVRVCPPYYFLAYDRGYVDTPRRMNTQYLLLKQVREEFNLLQTDDKNLYIEAHLLDKLRFEIEVHKFYSLKYIQSVESKISLVEVGARRDEMRIDFLKTVPEKFSCFIDTTAKKFVNRVKELMKDVSTDLDTKETLRNYLGIGAEVLRNIVLECMNSADNRNSHGRYWTFYSYLEKDFKLDVKILISNSYLLNAWKPANDIQQGKMTSCKKHFKYPVNTYYIMSHHFCIRFYYIDGFQMFSRPTNVYRATRSLERSDSVDSIDSPFEKVTSWMIALEEQIIL